MNDAFQTAIGRALGAEGGYVFNPADPGGETNFGISKREFPEVDIKGLTRDGAALLYRRNFWEPVVALGIDNAALQNQLLDSAVNHGIGTTVRFLQRAVRVADDGHWGPHSQEAAATMQPADIHLRFMAERFEFWAKLKTFDIFGRGWTRRGAQALRYLADDN